MSDVTTLESSMYLHSSGPDSPDSQGDGRRSAHKDRKSRYPGDLSPRSKEQLRLQVNARERERMHDINGAMDALRQVMPYGHGASVKKLSKMSTLLLARNYILTLTKSLEELRFCVTKVCLEQNKPVPPCGLGVLGGGAAHPGAIPTPLLPPHTACNPPPPPHKLCEHPSLASMNVLSSAAERASLYRNHPPMKRPCAAPASDGHAGYAAKKRQLSPESAAPHLQHYHGDLLLEKRDKVSSNIGASVRTSKSNVASEPTKTVSRTKCTSGSSRMCFCVECITRK